MICLLRFSGDSILSRHNRVFRYFVAAMVTRQSSDAVNVLEDTSVDPTSSLKGQVDMDYGWYECSISLFQIKVKVEFCAKWHLG